MPERKYMGSSEREQEERKIVVALAASVAPFDKIAFDRAFALLESMYRERLMRKLYAMLHQWEIAEEILQEALFSAALSLQKFPPERLRTLELQAWLYTITIHKAYKYLEKKRPLELSIHSRVFDEEFLDRLEVPAQERPETAWEVVELNKRILNEMLKLPKQFQQPFFLHFFEGYSYQEIVAQLDLPEGTLKSHLSRARRQFKNAWKTTVDEEG